MPRTRQQERSADLANFIADAKAKHGNLFDYSNTPASWEGKSKKAVIVCRAHGEFKSIPKTHITSDHGNCSGCQQDKGFTKFIAKSKAMYGDRFDYTKTRATFSADWDKEIVITCKEHGDFATNRKNHLGRAVKNGGCPACSGGHRHTDKDGTQRFKAIVVENETAGVSQLLYIMRNEMGRLKIGVSKHPHKRRSDLENTSGFKVQLLYVMETKAPADQVEKALHNAFSNYRTAGEWFEGITQYDVLAALWLPKCSKRLVGQRYREVMRKRDAAQQHGLQVTVPQVDHITYTYGGYERILNVTLRESARETLGQNPWGQTPQDTTTTPEETADLVAAGVDVPALEADEAAAAEAGELEVLPDTAPDGSYTPPRRRGLVSRIVCRVAWHAYQIFFCVWAAAAANVLYHAYK
jgi:hypothetical protein